ncbi:MAG: hypothetical protein OEX12_01690 [Gammaproteobacteria bacterium]|nr:hypothetical protein [Gammaproteobacteria bacterium]
MQKHNLIYSSTDIYGIIEVYQDTLLRSLHFGTPARQSAMYPDQPHILPLSYSRYMLAPLLFIDIPHKILILGLGAGSLFQFFRHHTSAIIDTVELRQAVVEVATEYFQLPKQDPQHNSYVMSALDFLQQSQQQYELCLVDIYNDRGIDETLLDESFYSDISARLEATGLCCFNLWSSHPKRYEQICKLIKQSFPYLLVIPVPRKGNVIILAASYNFMQDELKLREQSQLLEQKYNVEFTMILDHILTTNKDIIPHML